MKNRLSLLCLFWAICATAGANIHTILPGESIQAAIDRAQEGDTLEIMPGDYVERLQMKGKDLVLRSAQTSSTSAVSSTRIDGAGKGPVLTFSGSETSRCQVLGLTLTNGLGSTGGAILGNGAQASIRDCRIEQSRATRGGAIAGIHGAIENNILSSNTATFDGGALWDCGGTIGSNLFAANRAGGSGGAMAQCKGIIQNNIIQHNQAIRGGALASCGGKIRSNTLYGNQANQTGGGMFDCNSLDTIIQNCILWNNTAPQGAQIWNSVTPSHSCIQNWTGGGIGNIKDDPLFTSPRTNQFFLKQGSPAIDAGSHTGEVARPTQPLRLVFAGGGYEKRKILFNTYLNSWPDYKDLPKGSPPRFEAASSSVTLGNIMLGESQEIAINPLHLGPMGQTNLQGDIQTTGVVAQFTVTGDSDSPNPVEILVGVHCAGKTARSTYYLGAGETRSFSAIMRGAFVEAELGKAEAFIYSKTKIGPYEMVGEAAKRLRFILKDASMIAHHNQTTTGSLRDFEGDPRPFNGTEEARGDGSDFDMGADEYQGETYLSDLTPESIWWNENRFHDAQATHVSLGIRNKGRAASTTCTYTVSVDGMEKIRAIAPPISSGSSITRRDLNLGILTSGTHTISAAVDVNRTQVESNENNNTLNLPIEIKANLPDLKPERFLLDSKPYTSGREARIWPQISNLGVALAQGGSCALFIDGVAHSTATVPALPAGSRTVLDAQPLGILTVGTHEIRLELDPEDLVREADESNNILAQEINVGQAYADLLVESAFVQWGSVTAAGTADATVTLTLANEGDAPSLACICSLYVNGIKHAEFSLRPLGTATGGALPQSIRIPFRLQNMPVPEGFSVTIFVDTGNHVQESNKNNNSFFENFGFRENKAIPGWNLYQ